MTSTSTPSTRTTVGVSLSPQELERLDQQAHALSTTGTPLPRATALKTVWTHVGPEAVEQALAAKHLATEAAAQVADLRNTIAGLEHAWRQVATQHAKIGAHTNQIAKLANTLRVAMEDGTTEVTARDVQDLTAALTALEHRLEALLLDDADSRSLVDALRGVLLGTVPA